MNRHLSLSLLLVALALPLRAQNAITVVPATPSSADAIELRIPYCFPEEPPVVERTGFEIKVTFGDSFCGDPPILGQQEVPLPPLPPGEYHVAVHDGTDPGLNLVATGSFVVTEAAVPFEIHPAVIPTTPADFNFYIRDGEFLYEFCSPACTFRVGGVEVRENYITAPDGGAYITLPPPSHAPGFVDVEVSNGTQTLVLKNAIYYFDRSAPPDLAVFERVLFPVLFNARGANGSDWRSEALMASTALWHVPTFSDGTFTANEQRSWPGQPQYPHGTALLVPRAESNQLWFGLRVRDVSRVAEGFGTEIPVVRESQMFAGTMTLLDVPLDPAYRVKLRIYAFGEIGTAGLGRISGFGPFSMQRSCSGAASCAATPWFAEVDLPVRGDDEQANLYVTPPAGASLAWTFATVTNNRTQQVTTVSPDGTGGEPCTPCTIP
ncbi:MAG: hypothetical protein QOJ98_2472 [Acidobacteriota bacterium]|jgi:hypothetical protein|nr:hypothetical protein [Acidobacteriota bacterium]